MKFFIVGLFLLCAWQIQAQSIAPILNRAIQGFEKNVQMKHATLAMTVIDAKTGEIVYNHNGEKGMAPASTQKVITAIVAYDILGQNFQFATTFNFCKELQLLNIDCTGDPTLGSDRYASTLQQRDSLIATLKKNIQCPSNTLKVNINTDFLPYEKINEGWIWQDIGNYYGAGALPLNWRENKYDIYMNSDAAQTSIQYTSPRFFENMLVLQNNSIANLQTNNDNTIITYDFEDPKKMHINGSIPQNQTDFKIKAAYLYPNYLFNEIYGIPFNTEQIKYNQILPTELNCVQVAQLKSPSLDTMQYYFLHESINLYGEALLKTIAAKQYFVGSYENGIKAIHNYTKQLNIDTSAVHIFDGCGLSPQNRVTTKALCAYMQSAKSKKWYNSFYNALPLINNTKMKSGSIHQSRAYTGYIKSKSSKEYTFAIIVNGYDGKGKPIQQELWKIIDLLK